MEIGYIAYLSLSTSLPNFPNEKFYRDRLQSNLTNKS